jgi:P4 family phage/plasmid primase-like protien
MATMTSSSQYNDLAEFLTKHSVSKDKNSKHDKIITHTRIGDQKLKVYGGSFSISKEELPIFYRLYYEHIFVRNRKEYLTERQLNGCGPLLIDFDFRYDFSVTERQHTKEHIQDIIYLYLEELKAFFIIEENQQIPIFVMEKPNVNRVADKDLTKDGIHMIIGIQMDNTMQTMLRDRILKQIGDIWELPLTNNWSEVLDEGISRGKTNWQMYGSQKPGNEAYRVTYYLVAEFDYSDNSWMTTPKSIKDIDLLTDLPLLSAQYDNHIKLEINPNILDEYNAYLEMGAKKSVTKKPKKNVGIMLHNESDNDDDDETDIKLTDITNMEMLQKAVDNIMNNLKTKEHYIKEIHEYTQILPEQYYAPGTHLKNRMVAFALKHTDERLFLSWVMLRSKASDFDFDQVPKLYHEWKYNFNKREDGITHRSILYWAKQDAFEEYERVKKNSINYHIDETIFEAADWDYAMVLYHMFKDKYVCNSVINRTWYVFHNHKWEKDEGQRLRMAISRDLFELYSEKQMQCLAEQHTYDATTEDHQKIQQKVKRIAEICVKLKKTNDKNNIMREAAEIFYDKHFNKNIDSNPFLLCFSNGVFDFKNKEFRQGYPQDYITKTTGIPYLPYSYETTTTITDEINTFMNQLFPQPELCRYMWDHLAASLIGLKKEHAFNIYRGSGSNGKSILTDLMSQALGEYKGTVPITLVTDKRSSIGGATPEIMQLKGVRYAVMQEPSKNVALNEGILKELTGGDPLLGRALYSDSEIFIPQFSLVVCTNALFEIKSNDDGTWRRMKLVDFLAKFISEGETHTDDTAFVFPKDKSLKEKLPKWAPVFISLLVDRACKTDGEVKDCDEVISASNKYRNSQDSFTCFIDERIVRVNDKSGSVKQRTLNDVFKEWFQVNYGGRNPPKMSELKDVIIKKFGPANSDGKWVNFKIKQDDDEQNLNDIMT